MTAGASATASAAVAQDVDRNEAATSEAVLEFFRCFGAGVALVVADVGAGPVGMTVSTLVPVSLEPAMVGFCARPGSTTLRTVCAAGTFDVELLSDTDVELARRFADGDPHLRAGIPSLASREPRPGEPGRVRARCRLHWTAPAGDHVFVAAQVVSCTSAQLFHPLVWHRREFHSLAVATGRAGAAGQGGVSR